MLTVPRSRLLAVVLAGLLAWGIAELIVTDKEAIEAVAEAMSADILAKDWEALETYLHEDFTYGTMDREATIAYVRRLAERYGPDAVAVSFETIDVDGDRAKAKGWIRGRVPQRGTRLVQVAFDARLARTEDGWVLKELVGGYLGR